MKLSALFQYIKLFDPCNSLLSGVSLQGDRYYYIILALGKNKKPLVIYKKSGVSSSMKIPFNGPVSASMDTTPVYYIKENIGEVDADQWVDQNEQRIIPSGISANEIVNQWDASDGTLFSATVSKKMLEQAQNSFCGGKLIMSSFSIPLWNLAKLYADQINESFIIWKIGQSGSVLALVENKCLSKLVNFWLGSQDIAVDNKEALEGFTAMVKSLNSNDTKVPICIVCSDDSKNSADFVRACGYQTIDRPQIPNVPTEYHEAYANAIFKQAPVDFADFSDVQISHKIESIRHKSMTVGVIVFATLVLLIVGLLVGKGVSLLGAHYLNVKAEPARIQMEAVKKETARLHLLQNAQKQKSAFLGQKSILTYPVTELQTAFPEGTWLDDISFTEDANAAWNCSMTAFANESSLIPELLKKLAGIMGMSNIRMVYSEQLQGALKTGGKAIKLKIEGNYKPGSSLTIQTRL